MTRKTLCDLVRVHYKSSTRGLDPPSAWKKELVLHCSDWQLATGNSYRSYVFGIWPWKVDIEEYL